MHDVAANRMASYSAVKSDNAIDDLRNTNNADDNTAATDNTVDIDNTDTTDADYRY